MGELGEEWIVKAGRIGHIFLLLVFGAIKTAMRVMAMLLIFLSGCANELCVKRGVFAGDEVDYNGRRAEVVSVSGESYFCRVDTHPIMAKVKFK
jgi:hypothetical protein